jgi:hypothetical protein
LQYPLSLTNRPHSTTRGCNIFQVIETCCITFFLGSCSILEWLDLTEHDHTLYWVCRTSSNINFTSRAGFVLWQWVRIQTLLYLRRVLHVWHIDQLDFDTWNWWSNDSRSKVKLLLTLDGGLHWLILAPYKASSCGFCKAVRWFPVSLERPRSITFGNNGSNATSWRHYQLKETTYLHSKKLRNCHTQWSTDSCHGEFLWINVPSAQTGVHSTSKHLLAELVEHQEIPNRSGLSSL